MGAGSCKAVYSRGTKLLAGLEHSRRELGLVRRIRKMLRLKTKAGPMHESLSTFAMDGSV